MARKPNKRQRELQRWRDRRADATTIDKDALRDERRPLAGFESYYEISRTGFVWSKRLRRFIKHTYDPIGHRTYIAFTVSGQRHTMPVWQATIDSWLSADAKQELRRSVPASALGSLDTLKSLKAEIAAASSRCSLSSDTVFKFLLGQSGSSNGAS